MIRQPENFLLISYRGSEANIFAIRHGHLSVGMGWICHCYGEGKAYVVISFPLHWVSDLPYGDCNEYRHSRCYPSCVFHLAYGGLRGLR